MESKECTCTKVATTRRGSIALLRHRVGRQLNVAIIAGVLSAALGGVGPFSGTLALAAGDEPSRQVAPLVWDDVPVAVDSGMRVANDAIAGEQVIFSEIIGANDATWVRLEFGDVELAGSLVEGNNAFLRITSLLDGGVQFLNARSIIQWGNTSAYFNGRFVKVELIAHPGTGPSRVEIASFQSGVVNDEMQASICDGSDDRQLSGAPPNEPDGRIRPVGCTGWLIGERCFLTAGHCTIEDPQTWDTPFDPNQMQVVEFNVPLSNPSGLINFSDPDDQYPIQTASIQHQASSCWDDWAQFAAFENSNTGLTPLQAQGTSYTLASSAPSASDQLLRIRGYGTTWQTSAPNEWNQVLTFDTGPYTNQPGTGIQHRVDTTGGNSGSAVFMFSTGLAIGIHTCGGCNDGGGANNGTAINHPNLQTALNNPLGGCAIDAHCPGSGNCCEANGSPGCNNAECCEMICAADPFCCNSTWDSICADAASAQCPVCFECGHPNSDDCCSENDTPYCNDASCCNLVCANDPFCCNTRWDSFCAQTANEECIDACFECGHGPAGSCCESNGTPYCDNASCCNQICNDDPFCCNTNWDAACANAANQQCQVCLECGDPAAGNCCESNGNAYCDDEACCDLICASDPFCCNNTWDTACANAANQQCEVCFECGTPAAGSCCESNGSAYCNDEECCDLICDSDPFCCNTNWDAACASAATQLCEVCFECGSSQAGDCCEANGTSHCDNAACCDAVCASDPFCCNAEWDSGCASLAATISVCGCSTPANCPADLNGDNVVDIDDLFILLSSWGPCPGCPADINGDDVVDIDDLFILLSAWGPCPDKACDEGFACGEPIPWCDEPNLCACFTTFEGSIECLFGDVACGDTCSSGSCPAGQICVVNTCCNGGAPTCIDEIPCEPALQGAHGGGAGEGNLAPQPASTRNTLLGDQQPFLSPQELNSAPAAERGSERGP